jgi:hypothetical protein
MGFSRLTSLYAEVRNETQLFTLHFLLITSFKNHIPSLKTMTNIVFFFRINIYLTAKYTMSSTLDILTFIFYACIESQQ